MRKQIGWLFRAALSKYRRTLNNYMLHVTCFCWRPPYGTPYHIYGAMRQTKSKCSPLMFRPIHFFYVVCSQWAQGTPIVLLYTISDHHHNTRIRWTVNQDASGFCKTVKYLMCIEVNIVCEMTEIRNGLRTMWRPTNNKYKNHQMIKDW